MIDDEQRVKNVAHHLYYRTCGKNLITQQAMMNKQELEKIVKPLCWRSYDNGRVITAETVLKYNLKLEKVGECYLVHRIYSDNDCLEYNKPVSLETAKDIAWTAYLHTIGCIMETVIKDEDGKSKTK